jgi:hypothetical protein
MALGSPSSHDTQKWPGQQSRVQSAVQQRLAVHSDSDLVASTIGYHQMCCQLRKLSSYTVKQRLAQQPEARLRHAACCHGHCLWPAVAQAGACLCRHWHDSRIVRPELCMRGGVKALELVLDYLSTAMHAVCLGQSAVRPVMTARLKTWQEDKFQSFGTK